MSPRFSRLPLIDPWVRWQMRPQPSAARRGGRTGTQVAAVAPTWFPPTWRSWTTRSRKTSRGSYTAAEDGFQPQNLDKFASTYGAIETEPSGNDGLGGSGSGHITSTCDAYDVICAGGVSVNDPTTVADDVIADFSSRGPS